MESKIKVLHVIMGSNFGGISKLVLDFNRILYSKGIIFDFLSPYTSSVEIYQDEVKRMNGSCFSLGVKINGLKNKLHYYAKLKVFLKTHNYNIVHVNSGSTIFNYITAKAVKKSCNAKVIIHCHNTIEKKKIIKRFVNVLLRRKLQKVGDFFLSCSEESGLEMFSKRVTESNRYYLLPNAIDVSKYMFRKQKRDEIRKQYHIKDSSMVIGHIGRFEAQKNHEFIIDLFNELYKKKKDAYLILIGDGSLKSKIVEKVKSLNLEKNVIFTGLIKNVDDYLNAFDIFILPSLFEGFPITLVEAQANGLPIVASNIISQDTSLTDLIYFKPLNIEIWLDYLETFKTHNHREKYNKIISDTDFSMPKASQKLADIYKKLYRGDNT